MALDNALGEAHASLAFHEFIYDWNWSAEREFRRAIELNPNYALAHNWYAIYLANMARFDEGCCVAKRAQELDPLSLLINMTPGLVFYVGRRYDEAIAQFLKVIEMDVNFIAAHSLLGLVYQQKGMSSRAISEHKKVLKLLGNNPGPKAAVKANIALANAASGDVSEAIRMLDKLLLEPLTPPCTIAAIYAELRDNDSAFEWLSKAVTEHNTQVVSIKVDPAFDRLRKDARFTELLRRVGLEKN